MTAVSTVSDKLTFVSKEVEDETTSTTYKCNVDVQLAGDSIWDCELEAVTITSIHISEGVEGGDMDGYRHIAVCYTVNGVDGADVEDSWRMYTDTGFEEAVSALIGDSVTFTEQGMQDDGYASME
jgi:hypothetical protein